jgi:DNA-directed RNA polymerase specialized sigma24 family protein
MELSLEEIAHNLGVGLSAAKMRLYRAQDAFKQNHRQSMVTG